MVKKNFFFICIVRSTLNYPMKNSTTAPAVHGQGPVHEQCSVVGQLSMDYEVNTATQGP